MDLTSTKNLAFYTLVIIIVSSLAGAYTSQLMKLPGTPTPTASTKVGIQSYPYPGVLLVTMNDTTINRALNTTYQNLQKDVLIVHVFIRLYCTAASQLMVTARVNQTAVWLNTTQSVRGILNVTALANNATVQLSFYVPWRMFYRVNNTRRIAATATVVQWVESIPPTGFGLTIAAIVLQLRKLGVVN